MEVVSRRVYTHTECSDRLWLFPANFFKSSGANVAYYKHEDFVKHGPRQPADSQVRWTVTAIMRNVTEISNITHKNRFEEPCDPSIVHHISGTNTCNLKSTHLQSTDRHRHSLFCGLSVTGSEGKCPLCRSRVYMQIDTFPQRGPLCDLVDQTKPGTLPCAKKRLHN